MTKLTLDTNCIDNLQLRAAADLTGADLAAFSVKRKELGQSSFAVHLQALAIIPEQTAWADGVWGDGVWADRVWRSGPSMSYLREDGMLANGDPFEDVLSVVSNGAFPPAANRKHLTKGRRRQFRDAMLLALHAQHGRDVFVTSDQRGFIANGRRERLEKMLSTRICTPAEAIELLSPGLIGEP